MSKTNKNPLYSSQREKSGANTYLKYQYQYNWGLSRVISEHESLNDYAVFIELHEDVVVSDSLDASKARFSFNQVKTDKNSMVLPKYRTAKLICNLTLTYETKQTKVQCLF